MFQSILDCILNNEWCQCPPFTELAAFSSHSAIQWGAFSALLNGDGTMGTQHQKLFNRLYCAILQIAQMHRCFMDSRAFNFKDICCKTSSVYVYHNTLHGVT